MGRPFEDELCKKLEKEYIEQKKRERRKALSANLDYDLFVIDPNNKDTTPEQLRDCIYDALQILDERTKG